MTKFKAETHQTNGCHIPDLVQVFSYVEMMD